MSYGFLFGLADDTLNIYLSGLPLSRLREPSTGQERIRHILDWVRKLASRLPVQSGMAQSGCDYGMVHVKELRPSASVVHQPHEAEVYWLNVYGPQKVEKLGRRRVLSVPCWHVEELPGGAVLWLTRPTPVDFDTEEAREAQARALVHLRPELSLEETLAALRERSRAFQPLEPHFHPEVAPLLRLYVEREGLATRRRTLERFNAFQPPEVTEWLLLANAPPSDVGDESLSSPEFWKQVHRSLFLLLGKQIASLQVATPATLPQVDLHTWLRHWSYADDKDKASYTSALGLYLALLMVHHLHGRWVPRRNLEESYVVLGSRAWLPLVRARHLLESEESALTASLTQFYLHAARFASEPPHIK